MTWFVIPSLLCTMKTMLSVVLKHESCLKPRLIICIVPSLVAERNQVVSPPWRGANNNFLLLPPFWLQPRSNTDATVVQPMVTAVRLVGRHLARIGHQHFSLTSLQRNGVRLPGPSSRAGASAEHTTNEGSVRGRKVFTRGSSIAAPHCNPCAFLSVLSTSILAPQVYRRHTVVGLPWACIAHSGVPASGGRGRGRGMDGNLYHSPNRDNPCAAGLVSALSSPACRGSRLHRGCCCFHQTRCMRVCIPDRFLFISFI